MDIITDFCIESVKSFFEVMGTGASTTGSNSISLESFKSISTEYDKLKSVGLSVEEMHMILLKRIGSMKEQNDTSTTKEDDVRSPSTASSASATKETIKNLSVNLSEESKQQPPVEETSNGLVLLIDDSLVAAKVASKVLTNLQFEVVTAKCAKLGYDILLARKDEIILIFLDVVMPTVDGVECLQWIKDNPEVAHIPVYMLSGLEDQLLRDVCTERGAEGTLMKPLNTSLVKAIIKAHNFSSVNKLITPNASPTGLHLAANKSERTSNAVKTIISHKAAQVQTPRASAAPQVTVAVHSQGPAFKLCDSDFEVFTFPNALKSPPAVYLIFIPTIFMTDLYLDNAFMPQLFALREQLVSNGDQIAVISGDLPFALSAGKARFSLPFTLLSDPSLTVAERYVGTVDIGRFLARPDNFMAENGLVLPSDIVDYSEHPQNSFMAPNLGVVYISKSREVLNKWVCESVAATHEPNFQTFPVDLSHWAANHEAVRQQAEQQQSSKGHNNNNNSSDNNNKSQAGKHPAPGATALLQALNSPGGAAVAKDHKKRILVVDDSSVSSRIACRKIEALGYTTACAYHGHSAFDMLKKAPHMYDIVLSDVMMPVCDGMELLSLIKNSAELKHIPVIIISGLEGEELARNCLEHGAAALMKKPFESELFAELVARLVEAAEGQILQS